MSPGGHKTGNISVLELTTSRRAPLLETRPASCFDRRGHSEGLQNISQPFYTNGIHEAALVQTKLLDRLGFLLKILNYSREPQIMRVPKIQEHC